MLEVNKPANISKQVAHVYYELEALVDANKLRAYTNRIRIAENSMVAMELANAAFNESRQLLNDASTAIVRNKKVIIQHLAEDADLNGQTITDNNSSNSNLNLYNNNNTNFDSIRQFLAEEKKKSAVQTKQLMRDRSPAVPSRPFTSKTPDMPPRAANYVM